MTEITSGESHKKPKQSFTRSKKLSLRIDMTPMVDLGFLLITFFIFTTTMSQPNSLSLVMPDEKGAATPIKESGALTLLPAVKEKVYYYEGKLSENNLKTSSIKDIREIIINKKRRTSENDLFVIIKPLKTASYRDIVNILDEMKITDVQRYAIGDITEREEELVN